KKSSPVIATARNEAGSNPAKTNILWIASGFAFAMTNLYFTLKLTALAWTLRRAETTPSGAEVPGNQ
ncbi:MAG: hypothetical protein LBK22_08815, partial [Tannerella sp.]|nr:hypothetical protein [Tannerella sp.]